MTKTAPKIVLSSSRDIPFDKLLLSQSNVRRIKAGVSIEELAEDIARRGLLQGLNVRAVTDAGGAPTGLFEIPAGGRRYRALELLVKQKRLARTAPVPCVIREGGVAEEDSLAENVQRAPLHPLDQFRAFLALREKGQGEEEIAAAFFVPVAVVKQRLRLASVSPKLLDVYAEDGMTLDQLMAFTVNADHQRQEQVFERLCQSPDKQPWAIRRWLTEGAVRAADKRAQFIGVEAYEERGRRGAARPLPGRRRRLAAGRRTGGPPRGGEAARGRGRHHRRGLEVGRGGARAALRPRLRPASASRRRRPHVGGGRSDLHGAAAGDGGDRSRLSRGGGAHRRAGPATVGDRVRARGADRAPGPVRCVRRWRVREPS